MSLYSRSHKRLRARRNKLEAEVKSLRDVRDVLAEELEKKAKALRSVREEQETIDLEESLENS